MIIDYNLILLQCIFPGRQFIAVFLKMPIVQRFFGAVFISAEFTDISFEVKAVLCFDFYALGDVFRRNGIVQQNSIASNRFELERNIPKS